MTGRLPQEIGRRCSPARKRKAERCTRKTTRRLGITIEGSVVLVIDHTSGSWGTESGSGPHPQLQQPPTPSAQQGPSSSASPLAGDVQRLIVSVPATLPLERPTPEIAITIPPSAQPTSPRPRPAPGAVRGLSEKESGLGLSRLTLQCCLMPVSLIPGPSGCWPGRLACSFVP